VIKAYHMLSATSTTLDMNFWPIPQPPNELNLICEYKNG